MSPENVSNEGQFQRAVTCAMLLLPNETGKGTLTLRFPEMSLPTSAKILQDPRLSYALSFAVTQDLQSEHY